MPYQGVLFRPWHVIFGVATVILFLIIALILRAWNAAGLFVSVKAFLAGECTLIDGPMGAEDLQIDRAAHEMFVSATDRRALSKGAASEADGLYVLDLNNKAAGFKKLAGAPADFHPHGISLYVGAYGARTLMAVNHKGPQSSSVEMFDIIHDEAGTLALKHRASISGNMLYALNDVLAIAPNRFYAVSELGSRSAIGQTFETFLMKAGGSVVYFDGKVTSVAFKGLVYPTGIAASPDFLRIYATEFTARRLDTFEGDPFTGKLTKTHELLIPAALDNIDTDADGYLWVASDPKVFRLLDHARNAEKKSPSQVWRINIFQGTPKTASVAYSNLGEEISGASVASLDAGHLYLGTAFDNGVLDCTLKASR